MAIGRTRPVDVAARDEHAASYQAVEFQSDGVTLRGRLYLGDSPETTAPALVMSPGFATTVAGMIHDLYAEAFSAAGLIVLIYDHFGFGLSDGEPRHEVEEWRQARGYVAAMTYMSTVPEVDADRIAIWGNSMSGRLALGVAAVDERVAALVVQMPGWGDESDDDIEVTDATFGRFRDTLLDADLNGFERDVIGPMPVVSPDQLHMPSLALPITAFRWFIEFGAVHGTGWENQATWVNLRTPVAFDARLCASRIRVPTFAVTARHDEMQDTDANVARGLLSQVRDPKESLILEGGHFGALYPDSEGFQLAIEAESAFLLRHLAKKSSGA